MAVGVLFYLHFSSSKAAVTEHSQNKSESVKNDTAIKPLNLNLPDSLKGGKILFVNTDTLFEKYNRFAELKKSTTSRSQALQNKFETSRTEFENRYMKFQERIQSQTITSEEAATEENALKMLQSDLYKQEENMERELTAFNDKKVKLLNDLMSALNDYGKSNGIDYILPFSNSQISLLFAHPKFDITSSVLDALNNQSPKK